MNKIKKVKIVATLGPSANSEEMILKLAKAGVDVFRINLSHQKKENIINLVKMIRDTEKKINKPLSIMGDLGGLKIRIGEIEENTILESGQSIKITTETVIGNNQLFSTNHPSVLAQLNKGSEILIDDGLINLVVTDKLKDNCVLATVVVGGRLLRNKGFYSEDISLSSIGIPEKDQEDIRIMNDVQADALAISFVQSHHDVLQIRELLPADSNIVLIAKIETKLALENIDSIIESSDGILIARGDLGIALPIAEIPIIQKKLIAKSLQFGKPVITATQMLESMTQNPFPTRAEVTDVANAILDGTDAIMLSGETASGKYPLEAVDMMREIIATTSPHVNARDFANETEIPHVVSSSAGHIANKVGAKVIIVFTHSGFSAQQISRHRFPHDIIVALSPSKKTLRKLNFCWGVHPQYISGTDSFDHALSQAKDFIQNNDIIKLERGAPYVIVCGLPFNKSGTTNLIHVYNAE